MRLFDNPGIKRWRGVIVGVVVMCVLMDYVFTKRMGRRKKIGGRREHAGGPKMLDECALFMADLHYAMHESETYIEIGSHYSIAETVNISFDVFPDRYCHDGVLFSIGTSGFEYYEWKTKAVKTQFFVIEFYFSSLSMLMKALDTQHMIPLEVFHTYPDPYEITDAKWHTVTATRDNMTWTIKLDNITRNMQVTNMNNITLRDEPVYIGGKPGQYHYQFRGIIKNLNINNERVMLKGKATKGNVTVWHCTAPAVGEFIQEIKSSRHRARDVDNTDYPDDYDQEYDLQEEQDYHGDGL